MPTIPKEDQRAFFSPYPYPRPQNPIAELCTTPIASWSNAPLKPTTASIGSRVIAGVLPQPTYVPCDPKKKTHAKKQPLGHVPRPRNAFILFRCDFVRQKKIPEEVENDHRNISRIVGRIWREMSDEDKLPWVEMAEREKLLHSQTYPGYKYAPAQNSSGAAGSSSSGRNTTASTSRVGREVCASDDGATRAASASIAARRKLDRKEKFYSKKKGPVDDLALDQPPTRRPVDELQSWPLPPSAALPTLDQSSQFDPPFQPVQMRRSSSCPPPDSTPISTLREGLLPTPLVTRDDLARRPSRAVMYQSNSPTLFFFPQSQSQNHQSQEETLAPGHTAAYPPQQALTFPWARGLYLNHAASIGAYHVLPDTYGWESMPSRDPQLWTNWEGLSIRQTPSSNPTLPLNNGNLLQHGRQHIQPITYHPKANAPIPAERCTVEVSDSASMIQVHEVPVFTNPFAFPECGSGTTTPQQGGSSREASQSPSPLDSSVGVIDLERSLLSEWTNDTDFITNSDHPGANDVQAGSHPVNANNASDQDANAQWPLTPEQHNELWDFSCGIQPAPDEPSAFATELLVDEVSAKALSELFAQVDASSLRIGVYPESNGRTFCGGKGVAPKTLKTNGFSADGAIRAYRRTIPLPDLGPVLIRQSREVGY